MEKHQATIPGITLLAIPDARPILSINMPLNTNIRALCTLFDVKFNGKFGLINCALSCVFAGERVKKA